MISFRWFLALSVIAIQTATVNVSVQAETNYSDIVYNPKTKSYFQRIKHDALKPMNWQEANVFAHRRIYKDVRGRLAVVPDREVNTFLRQTFQPESTTWFGLRYFCDHKTLLWVGGQALDRRGYQNWNRQWYRTQSITCQAQPGRFAFMPVYYTDSTKGFRWQASGPAKEFQAYFVEFVTGAP